MTRVKGFACERERCGFHSQFLELCHSDRAGLSPEESAVIRSADDLGAELTPSKEEPRAARDA